MSTLHNVRHEKITLKGHPEFNESWLRDRIVEDVSILNLGGKLGIVGIEKRQFKGGRLDLLPKDEEEELLYEVELTLGKTDESHIVRTIEYWDNESRRYPNFDHCAVIVAEEITNRFFNVIKLFSRVPIIAFQLNALKVVQTNELLLHFTRVLDRSERETMTDEDGPIAPAVYDRRYWEERVPRDTLDAVDLCFAILREVEPTLELTYLRQYVGLKMNEQPNNFVLFVPKQKWIRVLARVEDTERWTDKLKGAGLSMMKGWESAVGFRLTLIEAQQKRDLLKELFETSYREWQT